MICMIVTARDQINHAQCAESGRINNPFRDTCVWLVCISVFFREGVGKIRVQQNGSAALSKQKATLSQPPDPSPAATNGCAHILQENTVFLKRRLQLRPRSFRTVRTPSTILRSFS